MRYFVETYGCTMNFGEGRELAEVMASLGYMESESADDADIVILNTCTVVDTTEKRMLSRLSELRRLGKEVVITGCLAKVQPRRIEIRAPDAPILPPDEYGSFRQEIESRFGIAGPAVPVSHHNDAILPISQGCLGNCSYCITKLARGHLRSYPAETLTERFRRYVDEGATEILLTSQDTACYGFDTGTDLGALLESMLRIEGEYRVRIGMMNPNNLSRCLDSLLAAMDDRRVYRFLHIPVQSGSDRVLKAMRRHYTASDFMELVDTVRSSFPDVSIATDLICGFPGETDEDHELSVRMVRDLRADTVNITRFSPRPGTDAFSMPQVHGRIASERSAELTRVKNETEFDVNGSMVNRRFTALSTEAGKDGTILRTDNYRPVVVREDIPLGEFHEVEVTDRRSTYLIGRVIRSHKSVPQEPEGLVP